MDFMHFSGKAFRLTSSFASKIWNGFSTMATDSKTIKLIQKIGTHSGTFHCDEALACYMLKQLPEWKEAEIVRTRDQKILDECEIVVDVGGVYDPKRNRFDHHQKSFEETISTVRPDLIKNKTTRLSSAGLVYAHYGEFVIREILKQENYELQANCIANLFAYIYDGFVEELDAIDNGVPMYAEGKPRYRINTHLSARVHRLNPEWNTTNPPPLDKLFEKAMKLVGGEFRERVIEAAITWWPARMLVKQAIENRKKIHKSGEIMLLEERCPWKDHLFALEEEMELKDEIKFVIFHDPTDSWRVQGIPVQPDSFVCRNFLHKNWRGFRDDELSDVSGIAGCIFCHATGFIGGNKTRAGALEMAVKSLEAPTADKE